MVFRAIPYSPITMYNIIVFTMSLGGTLVEQNYNVHNRNMLYTGRFRLHTR